MGKDGNKISTRKFLSFGGTIALGTAFGIWAATRPAPSILDAKLLGVIPVAVFGPGKPVVYLSQIHPDPILPSPEDPKSNIEDICKAALEGYDTYGIRSLLLEGFSENELQVWNKQKKIPNAYSGSVNYNNQIEKLLEARDWKVYPDSSEALEHSARVQAPIRSLYYESLQKVQYMVELTNQKNRENPNPEAMRKALPVVKDLRDKYQKKIDELEEQLGSQIREAVMTRRENALSGICAKVLEQENGILVVYGANHGDAMKQSITGMGLSFILVQDKRVAELGEKGRRWFQHGPLYVLPEVELDK